MRDKQMEPENGLYTAEIRLTKACNLSCRHCSVSAGAKCEDELTFEELKEIINQLSDLGAIYVVFTGGEPLLNNNLTHLVQYAVSKGLRVSIDTNGTLLSSEKAVALKNAGVSAIQVSIDGDRTVHDSIRGKGAFEKAVNGIRNSIQREIYTTINFTISRLNQNDLPSVIKLSKELGAKKLTMERFTPTGRGKGIMEMALDPKEFKNSLKTLSNAKGIITNSTDPLTVFTKEGLLQSYSDDELRERVCGGCTAGIAAITISYDGEVYPCPKLEIPCGNIRNSRLLDIWLESQPIKDLRFRRLKGRCGRCDWKNLCGGCRAVAGAVKGDYLETDPTCFVEADL
jgi:radical SAM protein with 4Fe4S-binding SPASM domain